MPKAGFKVQGGVQSLTKKFSGEMIKNLKNYIATIFEITTQTFSNSLDS